MSLDLHIAALPGEVYWRKTLPPNNGTKMLLRTIGDVAVVGNWYGTLGQYFTAWTPLPKNQPEITNETENQEIAPECHPAEICDQWGGLL